MQKNNNVILLDEFDYYKSEKDNASSNFIRDLSLTKVLMISDEGKNIIQKSLFGKQPISGIILVASQVNPNKYFDIRSENLRENLREDFFNSLIKYAPMFGASKISITSKDNKISQEKQSEQEKSEYKAGGSYKGLDANASYLTSSSQDGSNATNRTKNHIREREFFEGLKKANTEEIIKCFEEDGIDYKSIPLFKEMIDNFSGNKHINEEILISTSEQSSKNLLNKLDVAIDAKNVLFSAQLDVDYMLQTKQAIQTFQSTKIKISIHFHITDDEEVPKQPKKRFLDFLNTWEK